MDINLFIEHFTEQFKETDSTIFTENTLFKDLEEWSSMLALELIAMADEHYDVELRSGDIKSSNTVRDLFEIIKSKK